MSQTDETDETDAVATVLRMLKEAHRDIGSTDRHDDDFLAGYKYAIYHVAEYYIQYSGRFPCECSPNSPFPGKTTDGEWRCQQCDVHLVDESDLPRRDLTE